MESINAATDILYDRSMRSFLSPADYDGVVATLVEARTFLANVNKRIDEEELDQDKRHVRWQIGVLTSALERYASDHQDDTLDTDLYRKGQEAIQFRVRYLAAFHGENVTEAFRLSFIRVFRKSRVSVEQLPVVAKSAGVPVPPGTDKTTGDLLYSFKSLSIILRGSVKILHPLKSLNMLLEVGTLRIWWQQEGRQATYADIVMAERGATSRMEKKIEQTMKAYGTRDLTTFGLGFIKRSYDEISAERDEITQKRRRLTGGKDF